MPQKVKSFLHYFQFVWRQIENSIVRQIENIIFYTIVWNEESITHEFRDLLRVFMTSCWPVADQLLANWETTGEDTGLQLVSH